MNKNVKATVRTPVGDTEEIELEEIVRQGTVGGNKLCIVSTDRINRMGHYTETDGIRYPVFVDDKLGLGPVTTIEEMCYKMKTLETTKKYKYNTKKGKTEWMMMKFSKKEKEIEPELIVSSGKIGQTTQYKYMGDMYDESGKNESKIEHKKGKVNMMICNVNRETQQKKLGRAALPVRIMLIDVVIAPTILSNTETWYDISKLEQEEIQKIHHKTLTKALQLPKTTPYMGIISELNEVPFVENIWYRKFMFYYRLIKSDEGRVARIILMEQIEKHDAWYKEIHQYAKENNISLDVNEQSYEQFKNHVKQKIYEKIKKELEQAKGSKTKLRFINPGKRQEYINQCSIKEASSIMKIRLHMVNAKANYGGGLCRKCELEQETTEHVVECYSNGEFKFDHEKMEDINWLRKIIVFYEQFDDYV